jgi:hypothetical protein
MVLFDGSKKLLVKGELARRARSTRSSASLIVPFSPSKSLSAQTDVAKTAAPNPSLWHRGRRQEKTLFGLLFCVRDRRGNGQLDP